MFKKAVALMLVAVMLVTIAACGGGGAGKNDGGGSGQSGAISATSAAKAESTTTAAKAESTTKAESAAKAESTTKAAGTTTTAKAAEKGTTQQAAAKNDPVSMVLDFLSIVDTVDDTSDLPDWQGKKFNLTYWMGHGTGSASRPKASNDVVSPEVARVTGISVDPDKAFDNASLDVNAKMAILAATNDWPEIGHNVQNVDLVENDKLWDLTDLIPIYAPHIYKMTQMLSPLYEGAKGGFMETGRYYSVQLAYGGAPPNLGTNVSIQALVHPDVDYGKFAWISAPPKRLGSQSEIYVRDDILKLLYPEARTATEIEELYLQKGYFDREDLYDIPVKTQEQAIQFFYDVKRVIDENHIEENGRPIYATYIFSGQDNDALLGKILTSFRGLPQAQYFTYFNLKTQHISTLMYEDWWKEDVRTFKNFVRDGVAPQSCLIETNDIFINRMNNGEYAITHSHFKPNEAILKEAGKPYRYRPVYFDIEQDTSYFFNGRGKVAGGGIISIFKDKVAEEDLPQLLMWLDYMATDVGMKLTFWGPKSAGLFEDTPDGRRYINKEVEDYMINGVQNDANVKYNLVSGAWPSIPFFGVSLGGIWNPKYVYDMTKTPREGGQAWQFFESGLFDKQKYSKLQFISKGTGSWEFQDEVPEIKQFRSVKGTGFEPLLTKALAADTDESFDILFAEALQFARDNGFTEEAFLKCDKLLQEKYPYDWNTMIVGYGD